MQSSSKLVPVAALMSQRYLASMYTWDLDKSVCLLCCEHVVSPAV